MTPALRFGASISPCSDVKPVILSVPPTILLALRSPVVILSALIVVEDILSAWRFPASISSAFNSPLTLTPLKIALPVLDIPQPADPCVPLLKLPSKLSDCKLEPIGTNPVGVSNVIICTGNRVVTTSLSECVAAVVELAPLTHPVKVVLVTPVYVICSLPI